jgi:hypothetical protein
MGASASLTAAEGDAVADSTALGALLFDDELLEPRAPAKPAAQAGAHDNPGGAEGQGSSGALQLETLEAVDLADAALVLGNQAIGDAVTLTAARWARDLADLGSGVDPFAVRPPPTPYCRARVCVPMRQGCVVASVTVGALLVHNTSCGWLRFMFASPLPRAT